MGRGGYDTTGVPKPPPSSLNKFSRNEISDVHSSEAEQSSSKAVREGKDESQPPNDGKTLRSPVVFYELNEKH